MVQYNSRDSRSFSLAFHRRFGPLDFRQKSESLLSSSPLFVACRQLTVDRFTSSPTLSPPPPPYDNHPHCQFLFLLLSIFRESPFLSVDPKFLILPSFSTSSSTRYWEWRRGRIVRTSNLVYCLRTKPQTTTNLLRETLLVDTTAFARASHPREMSK